jgi:hypothetical protein
MKHIDTDDDETTYETTNNSLPQKYILIVSEAY